MLLLQSASTDPSGRAEIACQQADERKSLVSLLLLLLLISV